MLECRPPPGKRRCSRSTDAEPRQIAVQAETANNYKDMRWIVVAVEYDSASGSSFSFWAGFISLNNPKTYPFGLSKLSSELTPERFSRGSIASSAVFSFIGRVRAGWQAQR